ncbi:MAG: RNA polymerase sigma factor [Sulfobacillus sp.]
MDDQEWIAAWINQWGDRMTQLADSIVHDYMTAQDVAQEAFLRLYRWHQRYPRQELTVGWLYTVTRNLAFDAIRQRHAVRVDDEVAKGQSNMAAFDTEESLITRMTVWEVMDSLDSVDQECLRLFYYADFSVVEVARRMKLTSGGVRTRLYRARNRFAELWKEGSHGE